MVGYSYKKWVTPVKKMPGVYNTRTSLGPLADRVGIFAYALTPLSILLCMRESLLSVLTGVPYHHFNFLHRWLGHIIFIQSIVHTIGWCVIEIRLYQPQPTVAIEWIKQEYMIWGVVAMILLTILWVLSTPWARRRFGYEFFKKAHYVLAMVYIGACWAHWANLKCFLIPSLLLWFVDRGMRFVRTGLIHYKYLPNGQGMFDSIPAKVTYFEGNAVRLDFANPTTTEWTIGQHFFLTFSQFSIWQSHPFTPLSTPGGTQSYILRARSGETKKLADMSSNSTPVILTGPYGNDILQDVYEDTNILCIAGGTGISYVLPVILHLARAGYSGGDELIELVWVVRHEYDTKWIEAELEEIRKSPFITVTIHVTRQNLALEAETPSAMTETSKTLNYEETSASATSGEKNLEDLQSRTPHRPDLGDKVEDFVRTVKAGSTKVYVSGPPSMISDVRASVAGVNDPKKVWRGDERGDVELIYDERLE
jgi:ferric-chelate reductase